MPEDWKILITDNLDESGKSILQEEAEVDDRSGIGAGELLRIAEDYDALIVRGRTQVTEELLAAAPGIKVVGRAGVGVDNIDLSAATQRGVTVVNAPTSTSEAVAELAIGLLFSLARQIPGADADIKNGQWTKKQRKGIELGGRTLGIVGMGNIGSSVAAKAGALGMHVLGYDPLLDVEEIRERNAEPVSLDLLFSRADFISLHLPLTPETRGMIGGEALAQMKRGVQLVSTARGGIIDETALLGALESGQVAGAALDVFAEEPPGLTALVAHPSVIATPHIGAQTAEAQERASVDIAREVLSALRGETLRWRVV